MTDLEERIAETSDRLNKARQGLAEIDGGEGPAMIDEYTPSMDEIKSWYAGAVDEYRCDTGMSEEEGEAAFDRAIAAHDRELRERIAREIEVLLIGLDAGRGSEVIAAHDSALSRASRIARGEGSE